MKTGTVLLAGAALIGVTGPARADDSAILKRLDHMQHMMDLQQKQIEAQRGEIDRLKGALKRKGVALPAQTAPPASTGIPTTC